MGKRLLFAVAILLTVASVSSAYDFWGMLLNGSYHVGSQPVDISTERGAIIRPGVIASGNQFAASFGSTGVSGVGQMASVVGSREATAHSQEQSLTGGLGQTVFQVGNSGAVGRQSGNVFMIQGSGSAFQFQHVAVEQSALVLGNGGSTSVCQVATVQTQQSQQY